MAADTLAYIEKARFVNHPPKHPPNNLQEKGKDDHVAS